MDVLKFIGGRRSKCIFLHLKKEKKRVSPARGAKFERDKWQFWRRRDSGFAGIIIIIIRMMMIVITIKYNILSQLNIFFAGYLSIYQSINQSIYLGSKLDCHCFCMHIHNKHIRLDPYTYVGMPATWVPQNPRQSHRTLSGISHRILLGPFFVALKNRPYIW